MSKRIKGITVEIGGDLTGLDRALKGTNDNIKKTQDALKDVERLLKLDPKNVELLDQKQRLLSQSVEATSEKYNTLKNALENATASNVQFAKWEKAQTALQGQITKTENALVGLQKEQQKLEYIGFSADSDQMREVQQKIDETTKKLEGLRKQSADTYEELGRPISVEQYDLLQRELSEAEQAMKAAEKASNQFNPSLEKLSATMGKVSDVSGKVADGTRGLSMAAGAAAAGLLGMAVNAGKTADDLNTLSKQSGFSTEFLQGVEYAADRIDVSSDAIIGSMRKLKKNLGSDSSDVRAAFEQLNIIPEQLIQSGASIDDIFALVTTSLSNVSNELERDQLAMTLFGRSADELAGVIDDGGAAFRQYQKEAQDLGLILSQEALDGANAFNDGLDTLKAKAEASFLSAGASLAENLLPALESFVNIAGKVLEWISRIDGGVLKVLMTLALLVAAISPIVKLISSVTGAISGINTVANLFSSSAGNSVWLTFTKWALVIMGVVAAITLLIAAINVLTGKGNQMSNVLQQYGGAASGGLPGMANGGTLTSGSALVGEAGPEILTMTGAGAQVTPITNNNTTTNTFGPQTIKFEPTIELDGATLARQMWSYDVAENNRRGVAAVH